MVYLHEPFRGGVSKFSRREAAQPFHPVTQTLEPALGLHPVPAMIRTIDMHSERQCHRQSAVSGSPFPRRRRHATRVIPALHNVVHGFHWT